MSSNTQLIDIMSNAITEYTGDVKAGRFPTKEHSIHMDESALEELKGNR